MTEPEKLNAICFWLIKNLCMETNATMGRVIQENVTFKGKQIGSYEIIVRKLFEEKEDCEECTGPCCVDHSGSELLK